MIHSVYTTSAAAHTTHCKPPTSMACPFLAPRTHHLLCDIQALHVILVLLPFLWILTLTAQMLLLISSTQACATSHQHLLRCQIPAFPAEGQTSALMSKPSCSVHGPTALLTIPYLTKLFPHSAHLIPLCPLLPSNTSQGYIFLAWCCMQVLVYYYYRHL